MESKVRPARCQLPLYVGVVWECCRTEVAVPEPIYDKKEQLEQAIDKLKYEKAALPAEAYKKQLTQLLLELAKTQEALEK